MVSLPAFFYHVFAFVIFHFYLVPGFHQGEILTAGTLCEYRLFYSAHSDSEMDSYAVVDKNAGTLTQIFFQRKDNSLSDVNKNMNCFFVK